MTQIKTIIYALLARREYSSIQIEQKLIKKNFPLDEIRSSIQELSEAGVISDQRFTEAYIRHRQTKGYGPVRIKQELQIHGITQEMIEDLLDITDNAWITEIFRVWKKYFEKHKLAKKDWKHKMKQIHFLQQRGFTQEQINSVIENA